MDATQPNPEAVSRCTLCPAGCELDRVSAGPNAWQIEYPHAVSAGVCPRGSCLAELLTHRRRILAPARRAGDRLQGIVPAEALRDLLAAGGDSVTILLDGNVPCEQMLAAAHWCRSWRQAKLCFVLEPADEQLLLGTEASGADYLSAADLAECDGFCIIGDAFAANPACSRGIFERRKAESRTPIVVIDPGAGTCAKFATHRVDAGVGRELAALWQVAAAAGVSAEMPGPPKDADIPSAQAAGNALAHCRRLGVLISAEYARAAPWRQIGYLAGQFARARGGGVAPQTAGANALAAVRLGAKMGTVSLAKALSPEAGVRVAVGADVLGMLGWSGDDVKITAAAAALPNRTTDAAEFVLPVTMVGELAGTYLLDGARPASVSALLPGPAGILSPGDLVAALALAGGARAPEAAAMPDLTQRAKLDAPAPAATCANPPTPVLLLHRQATLAGAGALTAHASWQLATQETPDLRVSPADAGAMGLKNLGLVTVRVGGQSVRTRVQFAPELTPGVLVLPEGYPQVRAMIPSRIDTASDAVIAGPSAVELEA